MHGGGDLSDPSEQQQGHPSFEHLSQWSGKASIKGRSVLVQHLLGASSLLGLQLVWSTEFAQAGPYLLNLGLSKSLTSLVFLAGPLSGLIVQPVIGSYADHCKSHLGRRRPFILAGGLAVVCSLLLFGFPDLLASLLSAPDSDWRRSLTLFLAILSIWTLDFSINVVQAMDRALLVDVIPHDQQESINAWASRLQSVGSIVGYCVGGANLVKPFGWLAGSQIKLLTLFAVLAFTVAHVITFTSVTERILVATPSDADLSYHHHPSAFRKLVQTLRDIREAFHKLSHPIWHIFKVQFFAWFGLFSILFFSSTWITEVYLSSKGIDADSGQVTPDMEDEATRVASTTLMAQSIVFLLTSVLAPMFVDRKPLADSLSPDKLSEATALLGTSCITLLDRLPSISLPQAWGAALAWHSFLMCCSWLITGWVPASIIIALTGVPMALAYWAPYSLLGERILEETQASHQIVPMAPVGHPSAEAPTALSPIYEAEEEEENAVLLGLPQKKQSLDGTSLKAAPMPEARHSSSFDLDPDASRDSSRMGEGGDSIIFDQDLEEAEGTIGEEEQETGTADSAGTILGLHNTAIVVPQLCLSLVASLIFGVAEHHRVIPVGDASRSRSPSTGLELLFLMGGVSTAVAAWLAFNCKSSSKHPA